MSREDDFSISEVRRKREQSQPVVPPPPAGGYGGLPPHPPTNVGPLPPARPLPRSARPAEDDDDEEQSEFHVDIWRMLGALQRQWKWLVAATVVMGLLGFAGGYYKGRYTVAVKLIRRDAGSGSEVFKVGTASPETMLSLIRSWDVARRVEEKSQPHVSAAEMMGFLTIEPEQKSDIVTINLQGKNTNDLVNLANLYATETVAFSRDFQLVETRKASQLYKDKAAKLDLAIKAADSELEAFRKTNDVIDPKTESETSLKQLTDVISLIKQKEWDLERAGLTVAVLQGELGRQNPLSDRLAALKVKLVTELASLTEQHPWKQEARAEIARLEKEIADAGTNWNPEAKFPDGSLPSKLQAQLIDLTASQKTLAVEVESLKKERDQLKESVKSLPEKVWRHSVLKADLNALEEERVRTGGILRAAKLYEDSSKGYFDIVKPVTAVDVDMRPRMKKATTFGTKGAMAGFFLAAALVLLAELKDRTMKTAAEVERVTGLRVLASLGDLNKMTPEAQNKWAFRAWTIIAGQLNTSANRGMVCGFVSSEHGEGRSTWIKLLGEAASRRGLRVLTVATKPSGTDEADSEAETVANEKSFTEAVEEAMTEKQTEAETGEEPEGEQPFPAEQPPADEILTLSPSALAFPAEVTQRFTSGGLPAAHIPLPGWVWNLARRRQWQMALAHWRAIDNLVLLVELPPASVPESVLLSESLPQLIWLVDSGKASISATKEQLEMMHHAKCQIVGAVLNHEPEPIIKL